MKITNCGRGIHQREIPGLEKLKDLPDHWHAFTNLDLSLPGKGIREIDLVLVLEDRLLLVDLKDWKGPISSQEGNWFNGTRNCGRSPVGKIAEIARELSTLLKRSVGDQSRKEGLAHTLATPRIDCAVVLTRVNDRSGIAASEVSSVFSIEPFMKILRNRAERVTHFGEVRVRHEDFTSGEWMARFRRFFNTSGGIFQAGTRRYGGFSAKKNESPTFQHRAGIFTEFDVEEEGVEVSSGLLRRWDFTKAETRFQSEEGRAEIAGRERSVVAWLDDRNPKCGDAIFKPKAEDSDRGVTYWEVFERRRRMKRLEDFKLTELARLTTKERVELARQVLSSLTSVHDLQAAHLDLGLHSVWVEPPTTVKLSHLMAASLPEVKTLGTSRFQFLSSSRVPEDILGGVIDPLRKDVFLLGCIVHTLLFGDGPAGDVPEWHPGVDPDGVYAALHPWFEKCLDLEQVKRFANASEMLAAFNAALSAVPNEKAIIDGLERYRTLKSQRMVFQAYPETELIQEGDHALVWRSESNGANHLVKLWHASAIGDLAKERTRVLAFLERAQSLVDSPLPGVTKLTGVHWTGDAIVIVQEFAAGSPLSNVLEDQKGRLDDAIALQFLERLIEAVEYLHARSFSHGDIKPQNIVVRSTDADGMIPVLVDVMDFSCDQDGERISRAYAPTSGGRFERDRYAVTKIVQEVLDACSNRPSAMEDIARSIEECRAGPPANGTLLPLREAIDRARRPKLAEDGKTYKVSVVGAAVGMILPDEGKYWVTKHGPTVKIRGATEELFVNLDAEGFPVRARRSAISQSTVQRLKIYEKASFPGAIVVEGTSHGLGAVTEILKRADVAEALNVAIEAAAGTEDDGAEAIEAVVVGSEAVDDLSERISEETTEAISVDVPRLWRRSIEIEAALRTEVVALGESTYRTQNRLHVAPVQVALGDIDFDRADTVIVERLDSKNRWLKVGILDADVSTADYLAFSSWLEQGRGAIVQDGDKIRFQSKFENTSRQRREEAIDRILRRASVSTNLLDVFSPVTGVLPTRTNVDVDEQKLAERYSLNASQIDGFKTILESRPMGLLQGPPGTGKTRFIGALVHYALTSGLARNVLVASQSHEAVNNAAEAVLTLFGDERDSLSMIRVGNEGAVSEVLRPYHVARVERAYKDRFVATRRSRMEVAAKALGVSPSECDAVLYFEDAIQPVLTRLGELPALQADEARTTALKSTVEQLLLARGVELNLSEIADADIEEQVTAAYFSRLKGSPASKIQQLRNVIELGQDIVGAASTWQRSFETFLAGTRQVVAGTCVGLGRASLGLTKIPFDLVIVDEAARCTPSELAVPIQAGKWVVLVGDHAQLEPLHPADVVDSLAKELGLPLKEIVRSDFKRVFESAYGRTAGHTLKKQYRMLPPIGRLISGAFYERGLQHGREQPIIPAHVLPEDIRTPLTWINTDSLGADAYQRRGANCYASLHNTVEADVIVSLLRRWSEHEPFVEWLKTRPDGEQAIGVICAYAAQRDLVWKKLQAENLPASFRRTIKVDTIDSYQGKENLIVLLSLVRNNADGPRDNGSATIAPGFMARENRINVALSRAMDRLVIVGAKSRWRRGLPLELVSTGFDEEIRSGCAVTLDAGKFSAGAGAGKKPKQKKPRDVGDSVEGVV